VSLRVGQRDCGRFEAKAEAHLRRVSFNGSAGALGREVRLKSLGASADNAKLWQERESGRQAHHLTVNKSTSRTNYLICDGPEQSCILDLLHLHLQ
jgi:hypothetical protein